MGEFKGKLTKINVREADRNNWLKALPLIEARLGPRFEIRLLAVVVDEELDAVEDEVVERLVVERPTVETPTVGVQDADQGDEVVAMAEVVAIAEAVDEGHDPESSSESEPRCSDEGWNIYEEGDFQDAQPSETSIPSSDEDVQTSVKLIKA